jgi:radical SAM superfamily enzyme YgiQ (UPF0313 family)
MTGRPIVLLALYHQESFAVRTLHAVLEHAGFGVASFFFKERSAANTFEMYSADPLLVGINVMSTFFDLASEVTRAVQALDAAPPVIWGGIHPTIRPAQCLEVADMVCVGEGDDTIVELANGLHEGTDISAIPNLWVRDGDQVTRNEVRPLIQDLDRVPFPACSGDNMYMVTGRETRPYDFKEVTRKTGFHFMASRGCPFGCSYCANSILRSLYKGMGPYLRHWSVDSVVGELARLKEDYGFGPGAVMFQDDVFGTDAAWTEEFRRKYRRQVRHPFLCYCQPSAVNPARLVKLKRAGLIAVQMGIQSGSERMRHEYFKRHDTNEDIIRAARTFSSLGLSWGCDLLLDNPIEADADRAATLNLLLQLPRPFAINTHTLTFFPEYEFTKRLLADGTITEDDVEDRRSESFRHNRWTPQLDPTRDPTNMFWSSLYHLAARPGLSTEEVLAVSRDEGLRREPQRLLGILRSWPERIEELRATP